MRSKTRGLVLIKTSSIRKIVSLINEAQKVAVDNRITNILQPGLVKELIIAMKLGHDTILSKHGADASDPDDIEIKYEYLSCLEGGSGQMDRMFKEPVDKREKSLDRIRRNKMVYFAVFYKDSPITLKNIYKIEPNVLLEEVEKQLNNSKNSISHISFTEKWANINGSLIFKESDY